MADECVAECVAEMEAAVADECAAEMEAEDHGVADGDGMRAPARKRVARGAVAPEATGLARPHAVAPCPRGRSTGEYPQRVPRKKPR